MLGGLLASCVSDTGGEDADGRIFDDFDRPDGTDLGDGWVRTAGDTAWEIWSGQLRVLPSSGYLDHGLHRQASEALENVRVSVEFTTTDPNNYPQIWLRADAAPAMTGYLFFASANDGIGVIRHVAGVWQETWAMSGTAVEANLPYRFTATTVTTDDAVELGLALVDVDSGCTVLDETWWDFGASRILGAGQQALSGYAQGQILYDQFDSGPWEVEPEPGPAPEPELEPAPLVTDDFERPDGSTIGGGWELAGSANVWDLVDGELRGQPIQGYESHGLIRPASESFEDVEVGVDFTTTDLDNYPQIWLRVQAIGPLSGYIFYASNADGVGVIRHRDGLWDATWSVPGALQADRRYRLFASTVTSADGVDLRLRVLDLQAGDAEVIDAGWLDSAPNRIVGPGRQALSAYGSGTVTYDNYELTAASGSSGSEAALRILPVGDSITEAETSTNSYRRALWGRLQNAGVEADFVGSQQDNYGGPPPNPDFDVDHEGHWGQRADWVLARIGQDIEWGSQVAIPDVALVHVGTNDVWQGQSVASTVADLQSIVAQLQSINPSIVVLLAQLIPHAEPGVDQAITALNAEIATYAPGWSTATSSVIVVDQNSGFDVSTETYDGVHPNAAGEDRMAARWFAALPL